jgi:hypothetical protein
MLALSSKLGFHLLNPPKGENLFEVSLLFINHYHLVYPFKEQLSLIVHTREVSGLVVGVLGFGGGDE